MNGASMLACWAPEGALLLPGQADLAPSSQRLDSSKNAHGVLRGRGRFEDLKRHAGDISGVGIYASVCPFANPKINTAATPPGSSFLSATDSVETVTGPPEHTLLRQLPSERRSTAYSALRFRGIFANVYAHLSDET
jgi:hypothetical protein